MKVVEKGTDRTAYVHMYVKGQVNPLNEHGQYIDARDRAICCYVAVEEGHEIKIDGRFTGVTLTVAYDCVIDGVCRKANSYTSKSVQLQKNKKLDVESFLYQTPDGVIDTQMSVVPYAGTTNLNKDAPESIGTVEVRVYVIRQFDTEHVIDDACTYDNIKEDADCSDSVANFKDVPPQFQMVFEKNCSTLDMAKAKREKKKIHAKRPGTEPWAVFRFHYRTKESIKASKIEMSLDTADRPPAKQEAHVLELDSVPPLIIGNKPAGKNDGDTSVQTSSPAPTDMPSTPTKGGKKAQSAQPKVVVKKTLTKVDTTTTNSTSDMAPSTDTEPTTGVETSVIPKDLLEHLQSTPTKAKYGAVSTEDTATTKMDGSYEWSSIISKKTPKKFAKKATDATDATEEDQQNSIKEVVKKVVKRGNEKGDTEPADATTPTASVEFSSTPTVPHPADIPSAFDAPAAANITAVQAIVLPTPKDSIKYGGKSFTSPLRKPVANPTPIDTTTSTVLQKPIVPPAPSTPMKRAPGGTLTPPLDMKRIKADTFPVLTPTQRYRTASASPRPRTLSIEAQVAAQRKLVEDARKKRAEMARKKAAVDERLAPYKQRMAEELERLRQEMAEEEAMMAAEEEEYMASEAMLAEFEQGNGGI